MKKTLNLSKQLAINEIVQFSWKSHTKHIGEPYAAREPPFAHIWHRSKIPLVLTTKVTHLRSLLSRQPGGVYSVVRT